MNIEIKQSRDENNDFIFHIQITQEFFIVRKTSLRFVVVNSFQDHVQTNSLELLNSLYFDFMNKLHIKEEKLWDTFTEFTKFIYFHKDILK